MEVQDESGDPKLKRRKKAVRDHSIALESATKKRRVCAANATTWRWQEVWAAEFLWAEGLFDNAGEVARLLYIPCTNVERQRKVLVAKRDNLEKHKGKRTCIEHGIPLCDLKRGDSYTKLDCKHSKM